MAGHQRHDEHCPLPGLRRTGRKDAFSLLAQLLKIACQALIANDFRDSLILQTQRGIEHALLIQTDEQHHPAKTEDEEDSQQGKEPPGTESSETMIRTKNHVPTLIKTEGKRTPHDAVIASIGTYSDNGLIDGLTQCFIPLGQSNVDMASQTIVVHRRTDKFQLFTPRLTYLRIGDECYKKSEVDLAGTQHRHAFRLRKNTFQGNSAFIGQSLKKGMLPTSLHGDNARSAQLIKRDFTPQPSDKSSLGGRLADQAGR